MKRTTGKRRAAVLLTVLLLVVSMFPQAVFAESASGVSYSSDWVKPAVQKDSGDILYANEDLYITGKVPGNGVIDVTPVQVSIEGEKVLAAYNIRIYSNEKQKEKGKTWQPSGKKVQVHIRNEAFAGKKVNVYHLPETNTKAAPVPELVGTVEAEDSGWVTFDAASFSTYAITQSIEKTVSIGGSTYKITVTYGPSAGIPDGAELDVKEVDSSTYLDQASVALGWGQEDEVFYTKFLDISIVYNGSVIEPADEVSVSVELLDVEAGAEALEVVHFGEDGSAVKLNSTADGNGAVTFTTDSFSVFGFGNILRSLLSWSADAVTYTVQGFTRLLNPTYTAVSVAVEEGLQVLSAYNIKSTLGSLLNALYVKVDAALDLGSRESAVLYSVKDGSIASLLGESTDGGEMSAALGSADGFALVLDSGYRRKVFDLGAVELNGMMPKIAQATAEAAEAEGLEGTVLAAYDIHIDENGAPYQPDDAHPVDVSIDVGETEGTLRLWHIWDDGVKEEITDFTVEDGKVRFVAQGFSIYAITGDEPENARIGYRFWYNDGSQNMLLSTQYFRYKDVHPAAGGTALTINEPSIPGMENSTWDRIFKGWSKTSFNDAEENLTTVGKLNQELESLGETDFTEGTYVDLYANLKNVYYVTYVDVNPNNVLATEIIPKADTGTTFSVKPESQLRPTIDSETELLGWYDFNDPETVYQPGQDNVQLTGNMTLYPKVAGGNWLIFNDNDMVDDGNGNQVSGGASFTPPAFYLDQSTQRPADPVWTGYEFGGWYKTPDCNDGDEFVFGQTLDHDTTVYAKWIPSDSQYRVIIWKQRASDAVDTPDDQKNYDYIDSVLFDTNVVTGQTVTLPADYKNIYGPNGSSSDTDKGYFVYNAALTDQSTIVKADGSSVLNVYYDRKPVTLNFYTYDYTYTQTTGNSGTQYGLIDGEYIQLTRSGSSNYTWSYRTGEYVYTSTTSTSNSPQQYGIVDGQYVELTRHGWNNNNYYWTYNDGWFEGPRYTGTRYIRTEEIVNYTGTRYSRSTSRSWRIYKSFTGLYGSTLEENGYSWPDEYWWYASGNSNGETSGTRTTMMTSFLPTDNETIISFYGSLGTQNGRYVRFYIQNLDGTYKLDETVYTGNSGNGATFHISDKYIGYHAVEYRVDSNSNTWTKVADKGSDGYYGSAVRYTNHIDIRFERTNYQLTFYTNNGNNQLIPYTIPYGTSLEGHANQSPGQKEGHYFLGWYADPGCTETFDFSQTMPDTNMAVYGKWKMRRVRVVINPGASNVYMGSQSTSFRLDYDERMDGGLLESAQRAGYRLDGWYTDPEFTNRFLFSSPVNDETDGIDWDYQDSPRWAAARAAYGDDNEDHDNVRGILHLYAKWILDTDTTGINVEYDPGEAAIYDSLGNLLTTVPVDPHMYGFDGTTTAREAPYNYSDLYTFKYWEATKTDGTTVTFHPGDPVNLSELMPTADTTVYDENNNVLRYTVKLRAFYDLTGDPARKTTITYDGNTFMENQYVGGEKELRGKTRDGTDRYTVTLDKEVNQTIELPTADDFYLDGWELVGWSFTEGTYEEQVSGATEEAPNFETGQQVAADNLRVSDLNDEGNTLYAMWQPKNYKVTVKQVIENGVPDHTFTYVYKTGVESAISSTADQTQALTDSSSFDVTALTGGSNVNLQYYERLGHVIHVVTPNVPDNVIYAVRVNAVVTHDDGTTEILNPTAAGDYQVLGDVTITYTYSLKVLVKLQKRDTTNHNIVLTDAAFVATPVEFNSTTNHWENAGDGITVQINEGTVERYLQEGTYRITEVTAPENYAKLGAELYLTISKDSSFSLFAANGSAISASVAELKVDNANQNKNDILTIYDNPIRKIRLKKQVAGEDNPEKEFNFTISVLDHEGHYARNYDIGAGTTNNIGQLTLSLTHDQEKELLIPHGYKLTVQETPEIMYSTEYQWDNNAKVTGGNTDELEVTADRQLTFINTRKPKLTVKKQVTGGWGDKTRYFDFTIAIAGATENSTFIIVQDSVTREVHASGDGKLSFSLKHGDEFAVYLASGQNITITETSDTESSRYITTWDNNPTNNKETTLTVSQDQIVVVTNNLEPVAPTGYHVTVAPYILLLACGLLLLALSGKRRAGRKGGGADE